MLKGGNIVNLELNLLVLLHLSLLFELLEGKQERCCFLLFSQIKSLMY